MEQARSQSSGISMFKAKGIHGFDFPYGMEYATTTIILAGIGITVIVIVMLTMLGIVEMTVPHIKEKKDGNKRN